MVKLQVLRIFVLNAQRLILDAHNAPLN